MKLNSINNSNPSFGRYIKPDEKTQERIEKLLTCMHDSKERVYLADKYTHYIEKQKQDTNTTITIQSGRDNSLIVQAVPEVGAKFAMYNIKSFSELIRVMEHVDRLATEDDGNLTEKIRNVWDV